MNIVDILLGPTFGKILDKFFPDPAVKQQAQLQVLQMQQNGEFKDIDTQLARDLAQIDVDKTEALSTNFWVSGGRPGAMWICNLGLLYSVLLQPLLAWLSGIQHFQPPPVLDTTTLVTMLGGLLGISVQRHLERQSGTA